MEIVLKTFANITLASALSVLSAVLFVGLIYAVVRSRHLEFRLSLIRKLAEFGVDGYFVFFGKKSECSKQLAIILTLDRGEKSTFDDVLDCFSDLDATRIINALNCDNTVLNVKTKSNLYMTVTSRIFYDANDNIMAEVLYFKNVTADKELLNNISEFKEATEKELHLLHGIADTLPFPLFVRDENLNVIYCNDIYAKDVGVLSKQKVISAAVEPLIGDGMRDARSLAAAARKSGKKLQRLCRVTSDATIIEKYITEIPFVVDGAVFSLGYYGESNSVYDVLKDNHLSEKDYLKLFDIEDIAIAYFSSDLLLTVSNSTFATMWGLDEEFIKSSPSYISFLDNVYLKRNFPVSFSLEGLKRSDMEIIASKKMQISQMTLPSGAVIDRMFISNGNEGTVVLYKDVSEEILNKKYQTDKTVSFDVINNIREGIALFSAKKTLKAYNKAFISMWNFNRDFLDTSPLITEVFERKKKFFVGVGSAEWPRIRDTLMKVFDGETVTVENINGKSYEISGILMADGGIMLRYTDISEQSGEKIKNIELKESFKIKHKMLSELAFETNRAVSGNFENMKSVQKNKKLLDGLITRMAYLRDKILRTIDVIDIDVNMHLVSLDAVDVKKLLIGVLDMIDGRIAEKQIVLSTNCPDDIDWITVDEKLIRHMLFYILDSIVSNIAIRSNLSVKIAKVLKKTIGKNMTAAPGKDDDFYLVIEIETDGDIVSDGLDLLNIRKDNDLFGTNNRLMRKIIRLFDGFFISDIGKTATLKICLPYYG